MKQRHITGVRIASVACAVPRNVVKNDGEHARVGKAVGVLERRHVNASHVGLQALAVSAAERAMELSAWTEGAVDALIFVTQTAPRRMPSISCEIQHALCLPTSTLAFDVNLACSGYTYGLWIAASLRLPKVLLVVGDTISRFLDQSDAGTYPIFGDAVSATCLEMNGDNNTLYFVGGTDGGGAEALRIETAFDVEHPPIDCLRMDGQAVFDFAVSTVPSLIAATTMNGYVDYFLLHNANKAMLQMIGRKAQIDLGRMPWNGAKWGNTSSASIPMLMCASEATHAINTRKTRLAMFGFGAGFSYGGVLLDTDCVPTSLTEI